jgi:predicted MFS family arabinose efflux permease
MFLSVFFLFADQNLLAPNLQQCADDFGMSDNDKDKLLGGYISIGFFVIGGIASLTVGYLSDVTVRTHVFGYVILLGEGSCAGTYWVTEYWQLLLTRCLTGVAVGGAVPLMFSMLGDLYAESERVLVSTVLTTATGAGVAIGQLFAGYVGVSMGWRAPFLFVAVPSLFCGALMYLTVDEPQRGAAEAGVLQVMQDLQTNQQPGTCGSRERRGSEPQQGQRENQAAAAGGEEEIVAYNETLTWEKLRVLMSTPSAILGYIQGVPGCLPWGMLYTFFNDYLHVQRGMTVPAATLVITIFGIGGICGSLFGGWMGQRLFNRNPKYQVLMMGTSTIVGVLPILFMINVSEPSRPSTLPIVYIMSFVGGFIININGPNIKTLMCNVCVPEVRGSAFALFALTDDVGKGFGPYVVYVMIDQAFQGDRRTAFNAISTCWLVCGVLLLCLSMTYESDMRNVDAAVKLAAQRALSAEYNDASSPLTKVAVVAATPSVFSAGIGSEIEKEEEEEEGMHSPLLV